jgi:hypothetical protein
MRQKFRYKCPKCGHGLTLDLDNYEPGEIPKYPPTCQNEAKHHTNRVFEMELQ